MCPQMGLNSVSSPPSPTPSPAGQERGAFLPALAPHPLHTSQKALTAASRLAPPLKARVSGWGIHTTCTNPHEPLKMTARENNFPLFSQTVTTVTSQDTDLSALGSPADTGQPLDPRSERTQASTKPSDFSPLHPDSVRGFLSQKMALG